MLVSQLLSGMVCVKITNGMRNMNGMPRPANKAPVLLADDKGVKSVMLIWSLEQSLPLTLQTQVRNYV